MREATTIRCASLFSFIHILFLRGSSAAYPVSIASHTPSSLTYLEVKINGVATMTRNTYVRTINFTNLGYFYYEFGKSMGAVSV